MEWMITAFASLALTTVTTLGWLDARKKEGVDLKAEADAPEGKSYTLRNHGNRTLYNVRLDAEHLAAHRIEEPIFSLQLDPREPAPFEISFDRHMQLPDGVKIRYQHRWRGRTRTQYVPLPVPKLVWDGPTGQWVDAENL